MLQSTGPYAQTSRVTLSAKLLTGLPSRESANHKLLTVHDYSLILSNLAIRVGRQSLRIVIKQRYHSSWRQLIVVALPRVSKIAFFQYDLFKQVFRGRGDGFWFLAGALFRGLGRILGNSDRRSGYIASAFFIIQVNFWHHVKRNVPHLAVQFTPEEAIFVLVPINLVHKTNRSFKA